MDFKQLQHKYKSVRITGGNLYSEEDTRFLPLTAQASLVMMHLEYVKGPQNGETRDELVDRLLKKYDEEADYPENIKSHIQRIDSIVEGNLTSEEECQPLQVVDGKVKPPVGSIVHGAFASKVEKMESYADAGVMASEFFEQLESEQEGRLCCFFDRTKENDRPIKNKSKVVFYFDENHPVMQQLLKHDFFKYLEMKLTEPDKIAETFSPEDIALFEEVILPLSPGSGAVVPRGERTKDWIAIPGGVPSFLINGIQIHSQNPLASHLDEVAKLFPSAVIFDENNNVLREAEVTLRDETEKF